jgi:hypothetical protein
MNNGGKIGFVLLELILILANPALGDEFEHAPDSESNRENNPNAIALFIGVTRETRESGIALGIEYERRLNSSFGIGVLAEHTFGDLDFWVYAVPFVYHTGRWAFFVAPGVEDSRDGTESLVRLGGIYEYELGTWHIAPQLNVDFVGGSTVPVFGILVGRRF